MEKPPPKPLPIILLDEMTRSANIATVQFVRGNGSIQIQIAEQREAVVRAGEPATPAVVEAARFTLTPRALRQLLDTTLATVKAYEEANGPLPTIDQFLARAAMSGLIPPPSAQ